jgi:dephospho-CoA kinase
MVIGITGTDGAGKGTIVDYLVKEKGFTHYSSRDLIVSEIEKQGLPITRNQMRLTANDLRALHGDDFVVKHAYLRAKEEGKSDVVIESVRAIAEAVYLQEHGGVLLAIDADPRLRYERVQDRRSATDKVTFEQFIAHEELEKNDPNPHGMQKAKVMQMADYLIENQDTLEKLHREIETFMSAYTK